MPEKTPIAIPGSFSSGELSFVCDTHFMDAPLPGAARKYWSNFGEMLRQSGRLPDAGAATVSAWVLARLAFLSGNRFPFYSGEVIASPLEEFSLTFFAFTTSGKVAPAGKVEVAGGRTRVGLDVQAMS